MVKNAFVVAALLSFMFVGVTSLKAGGQQPNQNSTCCSIVQKALESVGRIKMGEKRATLEKEFTPDGGLYSRSETTYTYRDCPYIKIRVTFSLDAGYKSFVTGSPVDTIKSVSKPFIEYVARD